MQYMLLIYERDGLFEGEGGHDRLMEIVSKHMALSAQMREAGVMLGGSGLQPASTATLIKFEGGKSTLHDAPHAETREHLGGYYLIEAPDLDAAIAWGRKIPVYDGGTVEVRPLATY